MSIVDAYAAGFFDGEGTVTMANRNAKWKGPVAQLSSTSIELLWFLKAQYGGYISKITKREEHHKQAWTWSCIYNAAIKFFKCIYPYIKEMEKRRRIQLLIEVYPTITNRNGRYTEKEKQAKRVFEERFFLDASIIKDTL